MFTTVTDTRPLVVADRNGHTWQTQVVVGHIGVGQWLVCQRCGRIETFDLGVWGSYHEGDGYCAELTKQAEHDPDKPL